MPESIMRGEEERGPVELGATPVGPEDANGLDAVEGLNSSRK